MPKAGEITTARPGERFGRLTVIWALGKRRRLRCDCGTEIEVARTSALTSGGTRSCGCLRREVTAARSTTHGACSPTVNETDGKRYTRAYSTWRGVIDRTTNPNGHKWAQYGGRGITVCDRWRHSFENFLADMGEPPPGCSLDRIDNDGPYAPENCRWADDKQQARNKSTNRRLTFEGQTLTVADWSEVTGISYRTLMSRLRYGWSVERVLTTEVRSV